MAKSHTVITTRLCHLNVTNCGFGSFTEMTDAAIFYVFGIVPGAQKSLLPR